MTRLSWRMDIADVVSVHMTVSKSDMQVIIFTVTHTVLCCSLVTYARVSTVVCHLVIPVVCHLVVQCTHSSSHVNILQLNALVPAVTVDSISCRVYMHGSWMLLMDASMQFSNQGCSQLTLVPEFARTECIIYCTPNASLCTFSIPCHFRACCKSAHRHHPALTNSPQQFDGCCEFTGEQSVIYIKYMSI